MPFPQTGVTPHTLGVPGLPPPQVAGAVHDPQLTLREARQLSVAIKVPQFLPSRVQIAVLVSAVQPHTLLVPPPPHV